MHMNLEKIEVEFESKQSHPFISDNLLRRLKNIFNKVKSELDKNKNESEKLINEDEILEYFIGLFKDKIGEPYEDEKLKEIIKLGESRFKEKIPPGYKDQEKGGIRQYGDLIAWFQLIDKCSKEKKSAILITDDKKEDWWWLIEGKTMGPRPQLIEEFYKRTKQNFYMYQVDRFMEFSAEHLKQEVDQKAIREIAELRKQREELSKLTKESKIKLSETALRMIEELDKIYKGSQYYLKSAKYDDLFENLMKELWISVSNKEIDKFKNNKVLHDIFYELGKETMEELDKSFKEEKEEKNQKKTEKSKKKNKDQNS